MVNKLLSLALILMVLISSCSKLEYKTDFDKSYDAWISFKSSSGNSYQYMVSSSSWSGIRAETIITVNQGKVIQREFKLLQNPQDGTTNYEVLDQWTEAEGSLNTHSQSAAAETVTLDEIYQKAKSEWLVKRANSTVYLETNNDGMISTCGYVEDGCADDCFRGIKIDFIR
ncbi:MAG TPA: hypothetical protein VGD90_01910 [Sphingobacteriaceae bacterium]